MDPENVWRGLSDDLTFMGDAREENIRRVAQVARLMNDAGLIVSTCFASPYRSERQRSRQIIGDESFIEIFVDTPLAVAEAQDTQGFYERARKGEIQNVAGIHIPYEAPEDPDIVVGAKTHSISEAADDIFDYLIENEIIRRKKT